MIFNFATEPQFLICTNPDIIAQHDAKVYGKEPPGTPPMTVPHLDTDILMVNVHYYLVHSLVWVLSS